MEASLGRETKLRDGAGGFRHPIPLAQLWVALLPLETLKSQHRPSLSLPLSPKHLKKKQHVTGSRG